VARTPLPDWRWPRQLASSETFGPARRRSGRAVHRRPAGHYDAPSGAVISDGERSGPCRRGEAEAQAPCTAQGRSARSGDPPPPAMTAALGGFGRAGLWRCLRPLPRPTMLVVGSRGWAGVCWHDAAAPSVMRCLTTRRESGWRQCAGDSDVRPHRQQRCPIAGSVPGRREVHQRPTQLPGAVASGFGTSRGAATGQVPR
jgi:hypothetical protein